MEDCQLQVFQIICLLGKDHAQGQLKAESRHKAARAGEGGEADKTDEHSTCPHFLTAVQDFGLQQ